MRNLYFRGDDLSVKEEEVIDLSNLPIFPDKLLTLVEEHKQVLCPET